MKLKIIMLCALAILSYKNNFGMAGLLGGRSEVERIAKGIMPEAENLKEALDGVILDAGARAEETLEALGNQAKDIVKTIPTAAIKSARKGLNVITGAPKNATVPASIIHGVNTLLGTNANSLSEVPVELIKAVVRPVASRIDQHKVLIGTTIAILISCYLLRTFTHPGSLNVANLNKSNLVVESSGFTNHLSARVLNLFRKKQQLERIILAPDLANKAMEMIRDFIYAIKNSGTSRFKSLLLNGPKGTGKSLFIDHLIKSSNLDYLKINSSSFINFENGTESKAISNIFGLLKNPKKQIIVIIEEADVLLNRSAYKDKMMDLIKWIKSNNHKFMLVISAESKAALGSELLGLMDQNLELATPTVQERKKFLFDKTMILVKKFGSTSMAQIVNSILNVTKIEQIAKQTDGFSYSQLSVLFDDLQMEVLRNKEKFTKELVQNVVQNKLELKTALNF